MVSVLAVLFFGFLALSQQAIWNRLLGVDTGGKCTVVEWKNFNTSSSIDINVLSYITPDNSINISLSFQGHDEFLYLDDLVLYSHQITYYKKRDGSSNISYTSFVNIPEGWNQLKLMVTDKNVSLEWNKGRNKVSLLALTLDLLIDVVFLRGNFSVCSGVSPEWDVNEGKKIIQLQPLENEQLLEVTGIGSLLVDNETFYVTQPRFANTTLITQAWRQNSLSTIIIKEDGKEKWKWEKPETPWPQMTVRSEEGMIHLRLTRPDACVSDKDCSSNILEDFLSMMVTPKYGISHVLVFLLGVICNQIITYARSALTRKHDRQTGQSQEGQDQEAVPLNEIRSSGGDKSNSPVTSYEQESSGHDALQTDRKTRAKIYPLLTAFPSPSKIDPRQPKSSEDNGKTTNLWTARRQGRLTRRAH